MKPLHMLYVSALMMLLTGVSCAVGPAETTDSTRTVEADTPPTHIRVEGEHIMGNRDADVYLIEFLDYQCPVCARQAAEIMPRLKSEYIETGQAAYLYKDFPVEQFHTRAFRAAEAAQCAGDQGKLWEMNALLLASQSALSEDALLTHAANVQLNMDEFTACMEAGHHEAAIREDIALARALEITGTPTIYLAVRDPDRPGHAKIVDKVRGVGGYPGFANKLDRVLTDIE